VDKRRVSTFLSARLLNPLVRAAARRGLPLPGYVLLETTGRRSGQPRQVPVGKALEGDTLWVVAEHGLRAAYVRNIQANPRVRVRIGRKWRTGTAQVLSDDDWRERQRRIPNKFNSAVVRAMGTEQVTVRVYLDPASGAPGSAGPAPR
jgi:deazaflavin-dependent oxidoreductase (nitroreductase family)